MTRAVDYLKEKKKPCALNTVKWFNADFRRVTSIESCSTKTGYMTKVTSIKVYLTGNGDY